MSSIPTKRAFVKWDNSNLSNDFLQLSTASGNVLGWIDSTGTPQGSLGMPGFSTLSGGINTSALIVGSGGSLSTSGTGVITATNGVIPFLGAPTGSCTASQIAVNTGTGDFYSCQNGAWTKVGPTAGSLVSPITSPNPLAFDVNLAFKGPNPYVDVTRYGVRALDSRFIPAVAGITATMTAGQSTATVSTAACGSQTGNVCFQNGDGIVVYGAGATNTLSTPAAPTVTPSINSGAMNTWNTVASPAGSTTYNYQVVLRDKQGALSAASTVGTTATGQAILGGIQVNVTSLTRTNNSVAVITATPFNVAVGATIWLAGSTDSSFTGVYKVATVTDTTHFTFLQGMDTRYGATLAATGGTVKMYVCNRITLPATPVGGWQYYIYGRTGGSLTLLGVTKPADAGFQPDTLVFEDYGSPFMDGVSLPSYVPNTPPGAALNRPLVTTVVSGAGTTTLTLADNAINSVAGVTIKLDHGSNVKAAVAAAGLGVPVYIPTGINLILNSYTTIPANTQIWQAGAVTLNETFEFGSGLFWRGDLGGSGSASASFAASIYRSVTIQSANPGVYVSTSSGVRIVGLQFNVSRQGTGVYVDTQSGTPFNTNFEYCYFDVNASGDGLDYMGIGFLSRSTSLNYFDKCVFSVSDVTAPGSSLTPLLYMADGPAEIAAPAGSLFLKNSIFQNRGAAMDFNPNQGFAYTLVYFNNVYGSGMHSPFLILTAPGSLGGTIHMDGVQADTGLMPYIVNLCGGTSVSVEIFAYNPPSNDVGGTVSMVTGNPFPSVQVRGVTGPSGQNFNFSDGIGNFTTNLVGVNGTGVIGFRMTSPGAPSLAVSAGGAVPVGTWTYALTAIDANGNETGLGFTASVTTTTGNQTVTITPPSAPTGSALYRSYRSNGGGYGLVNLAATAWTNNMVDTFSFTSGPPPTPAAFTSSFGSTGAETFQLLFSPVLFANLGAPSNFTVKMCSDCTIANPCAGGGTGAFAKRLNGVWVCN